MANTNFYEFTNKKNRTLKATQDFINKKKKKK